MVSIRVLSVGLLYAINAAVNFLSEEKSSIPGNFADALTVITYRISNDSFIARPIILDMKKAFNKMRQRGLIYNSPVVISRENP